MGFGVAGGMGDSRAVIVAGVAEAFAGALSMRVLTLIALIAGGIIKAKLASTCLVRSVVEIVVMGGLSAGGGYALGLAIPRLFGY